MKALETPELIFWVLVGILIAALIFFFAGQLLFGYMKVTVTQP